MDDFVFVSWSVVIDGDCFVLMELYVFDFLCVEGNVFFDIVELRFCSSY